ncbi:hypothetical protein DFH06DRAFT_619137 [Mycena polygramma]|nr:hypothetical protein DFH06DRAFT_619137 [Mycena polygramma]
MVGFRNKEGSAAIAKRVSHCCSRLLLPFGRGSAGCVAIDNGDSTWSVTFRKSLPSDAYRYVIRGKDSR